jgi:ABC-type phosphate/phosphonate transport system permease subunit
MNLSATEKIRPPAPEKFASVETILHLGKPSRTQNLNSWLEIFLPLGVGLLLLAAWHCLVRLSGSDLFPTPFEVMDGIGELAREGVLFKYVVASLFRVTWGFLVAVAVGVPLGLWLGWHARAYRAINPIIQVFRPISPIAWIPIAILWFGVADLAPIFLIFLASVSPITVASTAAVQNIQPVYLRAAENFGLSKFELFRSGDFSSIAAPDPDWSSNCTRNRLVGCGRGRDDCSKLGSRLSDYRRAERGKAL